MDKYIYDETNGLWYELHGDYYLPCVTAPERKPVGIFGNRYRKHLKQHKNPVYTATLLAGTLEDHVADYTATLLAGTLEDHVAEIDREAEELLDRLIKQMAEQKGITEQLKARDPMEWVRQMNNIRNRAVEVVNNDLIYT